MSKELIALEDIKMIAKLMRMHEGEVLNTSLITLIGSKMKPRNKDYETIGKVTGNSANIMIKGRSGRYSIPSRLKELFATYGEDLIKSDLFRYSCQLTENTLNAIVEGEASKTTRKKYLEALDNPNLISMMLQLSVRIIAFDLIEKDIELPNRTLHHMANLIIKDKSEITQMFKQAYKEDRIEEAIGEYYNKLNKYFNNYLDEKIELKRSEAIQLGREENLVEMIGEENLLMYLQHVCEQIRNTIYTNFQHQYQINFDSKPIKYI